ncbi:hypothetical protein V2J09_020183 [Rumex salicifolius]
MANNGQVVFSKKLSKTDILERLHWPSRYLNLLPFDSNDQHADFIVKDLDGRRWPFRCTKRVVGYDKSVISSVWKLFVNSKEGLKAGDEVIFYQNDNVNEALFVVSIRRKVSLLGEKSNMEGLMYTFTQVDETAR